MANNYMGDMNYGNQESTQKDNGRKVSVKAVGQEPKFGVIEKFDLRSGFYIIKFDDGTSGYHYYSDLLFED